MQADGDLNNEIKPDGEREGQLEGYGLAVSGKKGELRFNTEWSHEELDKWFRKVLPKPFQYLDEVRDDNVNECAWRLLKTSRNKLHKSHAKPPGFVVSEAKSSAGRTWSDSKVYIGMCVRAVQCRMQQANC